MVSSQAEDAMVKVLKKAKGPMSLAEIVSEIQKLHSTILSGQTPTKSLYSIVYRREKRRREDGEKPLFKLTNERRDTLYSLNK